MTTTADALRRVPLFQGMTDRSIDIISGFAEEATFAAGTTLVVEGDPGESLIILREGSATVDQGGRPLRQLGSGDFLGEIALIDGGPRTATVTATSPISAIVIDRSGFARLMDEFPVVRFDLVSALTRRVREGAATPALD